MEYSQLQLQELVSDLELSIHKFIIISKVAIDWYSCYIVYTIKSKCKDHPLDLKLQDFIGFYVDILFGKNMKQSDCKTWLLMDK